MSNLNVRVYLLLLFWFWCVVSFYYVVPGENGIFRFQNYSNRNFFEQNSQECSIWLTHWDCVLCFWLAKIVTSHSFLLTFIQYTNGMLKIPSDEKIDTNSLWSASRLENSKREMWFCQTAIDLFNIFISISMSAQSRLLNTKAQLTDQCTFQLNFCCCCCCLWMKL